MDLASAKVKIRHVFGATCFRRAAPPDIVKLSGFAVVLTRASIVKTPYTPLYKDRVLSSWCFACFENGVQLLI